MHFSLPADFPLSAAGAMRACYHIVHAVEQYAAKAIIHLRAQYVSPLL